MCDISIIVLIYNQPFEKIRLTLNSIMLQRNVEFEIIVSDDFSNADYSYELDVYFKSRNFSSYKFIRNYTNMGTIANALNAINRASADVVKLISPGDFFSGQDVLYNWLICYRNVDAKISFGDTVYYRSHENEIEFIKRCAMPRSIDAFGVDASFNKKIVYYWWFHDQIHGASMMVDKNIILKYLGVLESVKIKYCEDIFVYLAVFDNISIKYFPNPCIWYECGEGISSESNLKGNDKIVKDINLFYDYVSRVLVNNKNADLLKEIVMLELNSNNIRKCSMLGMVKLLYYKIIYNLSIRLNKRMTPIPSDKSWYYKLINC